MSYQHKYVDGTNIHFPLGRWCASGVTTPNTPELDN